MPLLRALREAGGRALVVGGFVRDQLLRRPCKDLDLEIFGLAAGRVEEVLAHFGSVLHMGRAFSVMRVKGFDVDISLPSRTLESPGDPGLDFATACRRRDLTINSMGWDPIDDELIDPLGGREDLARGVLRASDVSSFGDDPLRGLRVARFRAALEMEPESELCRQCAGLDLTSLAPERVFGELCRMLVEPSLPSRAIAFLRETGMLRFFPELASLVDVPQDPRWHPEGCVFTHTLMVLDEAAKLRVGDAENDLALMMAALCHDFGKPATTREADGRVRSHAHERAGLPATEAFLSSIRAPLRLRERVAALVDNHLAPALFEEQGATPRAYRRLARRLAAADVNMELLARLARADHLGRTAPDALARDCGPIDRFLAQARTLEIERSGPDDVVLGRHVVARGVPAGPEVGRVLERCREVQDEQGLRNPDAILNQVLGPGSEVES